MISIIIPTYNRAHVLSRAIDSVLKQTYENWELIIVDDGSTDNTQEILRSYNDHRLRCIQHERNKGVTAALNTGLENIQGEWFTLLGSDDEMIPDALNTMMGVLVIHPKVNAITCNCIDSTTGTLSGKGLYEDQFLDIKKIIQDCSGEHWGITKTELLGSLRFNEKIPGGEDMVWYKIERNATRFYIHKPLRIYHTEGEDRVSKSNLIMDNNKRNIIFTEMYLDKEYIEILKQWNSKQYLHILFNFTLYNLISGNKTEAEEGYKELRNFGVNPKTTLIWFGMMMGKRALLLAIIVYDFFRRFYIRIDLILMRVFRKSI